MKTFPDSNDDTLTKVHSTFINYSLFVQYLSVSFLLDGWPRVGLVAEANEVQLAVQSRVGIHVDDILQLRRFFHRG